jgi:hypothetical protein
MTFKSAVQFLQVIFDRTLQSLVDKIFPHFLEEEKVYNGNNFLFDY